MKIISTAFLVALGLINPLAAFAQWDYGQSSIYNGVEARIDTRKTRDRIRARQGKSSKRNGETATSRKRQGKSVKRTTAPVVKAASLPRHDISIHRDTFQDFHQDDANGYVVTFRFQPATGKALTKTYRYSHLQNRQTAQFNDLPPAVYSVKASALYRGKTFPVRLGTEQGSSSEPKGGNFAPSLRLEVRAAPDAYGDKVIQGFPNTLYLRVAE